MCGLYGWTSEARCWRPSAFGIHEGVELLIILFSLVLHLKYVPKNEADMSVVTSEYSERLSKPLKLVGIVSCKNAVVGRRPFS